MGMIKLPEGAQTFFKDNIDSVFESGCIAEGPWIDALEQEVRSIVGSSFSTSFCSNGAGLNAILTVLRKERGFTKYIIQANTMYGMKLLGDNVGMSYEGAVPSSIDTLMPTASQVDVFLSGLRKPAQTVFVLSHIGGIVNPDVEEIADICSSYGVCLVEDCAHSLGATLNGRHSGTFGLAGVYSLYATKAIPSGEGGISVTNDDDLGEKLARFVKYDRFEMKMDVGLNLRVSEIQALLSFSVIRELQTILDDKREIGALYDKACERLGLRYVPQQTSVMAGNYYKYILLDTSGELRSKWGCIDQTSPVYGYSMDEDRDGITSGHICLPIWYGLERSAVQNVIGQLEGLQ